jgi:hypothetical protein
MPGERSGGCSAGLRPAPAEARAKAKAKAKAKARAALGCSVGKRGGVGWRGRRKPIPGGLAAASMPRTSRHPTPPRLRQFPDDGWIASGGGATVGLRLVDPRHAWMGSVRSRGGGGDTASASAFALLFSFRGGRNRRNVSGAGRVGLRRGVSRMDAAPELTRTYLQRPQRSPARSANPTNPAGAFRDQPQTPPRGAASLAENPCNRLQRNGFLP